MKMSKLNIPTHEELDALRRQLAEEEEKRRATQEELIITQQATELYLLVAEALNKGKTSFAGQRSYYRPEAFDMVNEQLKDKKWYIQRNSYLTDSFSPTMKFKIERLS